MRMTGDPGVNTKAMERNGGWGVAYIEPTASVNKTKRISCTKCERAYRGHQTSIECVVVHVTNLPIVIPDEAPDVEWRDGQRVVTTEQICDLHGVPRGGVYLKAGIIRDSSQLKGANGAYECHLVIEPKHQKIRK